MLIAEWQVDDMRVTVVTVEMISDKLQMMWPNSYVIASWVLHTLSYLELRKNKQGIGIEVGAS